MITLRCGLDIDQVLADFMNAYINRFGETSSHEITKNCLSTLKYDKKFWENLQIIRKPDFPVTLFCTKRVNPKTYTKNWLRKAGFDSKIPVYQVFDQTKNKADYIKGRIDVFIDDDERNVKSINKSGIPCLLMDSPWNKDWNTNLRIHDLNYITIVTAYEQNFRRIKTNQVKI